MKRIYLNKLEDKNLHTEVRTSFNWIDKNVRVNVFSRKCMLDTNYLKPYKNI